jgi:hypothetical protein
MAHDLNTTRKIEMDNPDASGDSFDLTQENVERALGPALMTAALFYVFKPHETAPDNTDSGKTAEQLDHLRRQMNIEAEPDSDEEDVKSSEVVSDSEKEPVPETLISLDHHERGPAMVYLPEGCEVSDVTSVVFYVHGYGRGMNAEKAWKNVETQFKKSPSKNTMFVLVSGPAKADDKVLVNDPHMVLNDAFEALGGEPDASSLEYKAIAHSGGYRTILKWLGSGAEFSSITLLDALYAGLTTLKKWLTADESHRLNIIQAGQSTDKATRYFLAGLSDELLQQVYHEDLRRNTDHYEVVDQATVFEAID